MNDITKTPAAELVGEYEELAYKYQNWDGDSIPEPTQRDSDRVDEIAQELERRCEAAGMKIGQSNEAEDGDGEEETFFMLEDWVANPSCEVWIRDYKEFHALLGWLLMKGGQAV